MISLKSHLQEAKFNPTMIGTVVQKLSRVVATKLGTKFLPYGKDGHQELKASGKIYDSYLYFTPQLKAVRFNTFRGEFDSIEIWNKYKVGAKSDWTIRLDGLNIVQLIDTLIPFIKTPKETTQKFYFLPEQFGVDIGTSEHLTEARHVKDPKEFHALAIKTFGTTRNIQALSWADVNEIGVTHDVSIPGWVRANGKGKGIKKTFSAIPPQSASSSESKDEPTLYFKISKRDPETNKFVSIADDQEALKLTDMIKDFVHSPQSQAASMRDPLSLFRKMSDLVKLVVVKKLRPSVFIYGGAGTGKTYCVQKTLTENNLNENRDWIEIKGKISPLDLYKNMYLFRHEGKTIVFDDCDKAFSNSENIDVLKGALDSKAKRFVSWASNRTMNVNKMTDEQRLDYEKKIDQELIDDPEASIKFPSKFQYEGSCIFITNADEDSVDEAIRNRSYNIDMTLTEDEMIRLIEARMPELEPHISHEQKVEVLKAVVQTKNWGQIKYLSMRNFVEVLKVAGSGIENWKELIPHV